MDLLKGNNGVAEWDVLTMVHPSFVGMLFFCMAPTFYMYYEAIVHSVVGGAKAQVGA